MPIFTYEKHQSSKSLADKLAMVDTSYMIVLSDEDDSRNPIVAPFHINATQNGATFAINSVVRQEFIKDVRKKVLVDAILALSVSDENLADRYKLILGQDKPVTEASLRHGYDRIYKDHIKKADTFLIRSSLATSESNIWEKVSRFESAAHLTYTRPKTGTSADGLWISLGSLMAAVCMDATDAMITNLAINIGADAIVTADCDFACLSPIFDIYLPKDIAEQCQGYDETIDEAAAHP